MSKTVDDRVLEMRFDNKQFESGVQTSMSTLEKLKNSLKLSGAAQGLQSIGSAAKNTGISGLSSGVETVTARFSTLQMVAANCLSNIAMSAMNTGKRMISALTIDPITTGFKEYETQIGAIQTILANTESKGTTLGQVNAALDELNTYADQTIYNFTEMTKNIGTFTAAGVDLRTSVTSIKGIANLAAVSGSNSEQASRAMYQLSQALAAGRVSLMDWNSVVNAGMGGEVFQTALKRTAKNMGTDVDAIIKKYGSFRESLTQGEWLTTEVLTETLTQLSGAYTEAELIEQGYTKKQAAEIVKLADTAVGAATEVKTFTQLWDTLKESAQSGWTNTWEILVGDFGEAKDLLTGISNTVGGMINDTAEARNKVLSEGLSTGWKQMINQGINDEEFFRDITTQVAKDHNVAIDQMIEDTGSFEESLKEGWMTADILEESIGKMTDKVNKMSKEELDAAGYTSEHVKKLNELNEGVKNGSIDLDEYAAKMSRMSGRENIIQGLSNVFSSLLDVLRPVKEAFTEVFPPITGEQLYDATVKFKEFTETLKPSEEMLNNIKTAAKGFFSIFGLIGKAVSAVLSPLLGLTGGASGIFDLFISGAAAIGSFFTALNESATAASIFSTISDGLSSAIGFIVSLFNEACSVVKDFASIFGDAFATIGENIAGVLSGEGFSGLTNLANTGMLGLVAVSIARFFKGITDSVDGAGGVLEGITDTLDEVRGCFEAYQTNLKSDALLKIAGAIGILAVSLLLIASIDPEAMSNALGGITVLFVELMTAMALFGKMDLGKAAGLVKAIGTLLALSTAILILAAALKLISTIDPVSMAVSLGAIIVMMYALVKAIDLMRGAEGKLTKFAGQMVLISIAVGMLASAMKLLGTMSWEELAKGGAGIAGAIGALVIAAKIMNSEYASITRFAGQMVLMAVAISSLAGVAKLLGSMSWGELAKAGVGLAGIVAALVGAAVLMNKHAGKTMAFAGQMLAMSIGIGIMASALKSISTLSGEQLAIGLIGIGGAMAILAVGLRAMSGTLAGAGALLVASVALNVLSSAITRLSGIGVPGLIISLVALAGAFVIFGVAGAVLGPLIPAILGISAALAVFGIGCLAVGVGVLALASGLVILTSVIGSIPDLVVGLAEGIVLFAATIATQAAVIADALLQCLVAVVDSLADAAPALVDGLMRLLVGVFAALAPRMPELVDALADVLVSAFGGIANRASDIIGALVELLTAVFQGLIEHLGTIVSGVLEPILQVIKDLLIGVFEALGPHLPGIVQTISDALVQIVDILAPFIPEIRKIVDAVKEAIIAICDALSGIVGQLAPIIDSIANLIRSLGGVISSILWGLVGVINSVFGGISGVLYALGDVFSSVFNGIADVISSAGDTIQSVLDGIAEVVESVGGAIQDVLEGIASVIEAIGSAALDAGTGFQNLADGVATITNLSFGDMVASLGAVAGAIGDIADHSGNLTTASTGLQQIVAAARSAAAAFANIDNCVTSVATGITNIGPAMTASMAIVVSSIGSSIASFTRIGTAATTYSNNVKMAFASMSASIVTFASSIGVASTAGMTLMTSLAAGVMAGSGTVVAAISSTMSIAMAQTIGMAGIFLTVGIQIAMNLANGVRSGIGAVAGSVGSMLSSAVTAGRVYYTSFYSIGSYLSEGLAKGLEDNAYRAEQAAERLAKAAEKAAKAKAEIESPSKVFMRLGKFIAEGFAIGIEKNSDMASDSAGSMAENVIGATSDAISRIADAFNTGIDMDVNPVVRPVVDMSNVESSAKSIDGMFGNLPIGATISTANSIGSTMKRMNQNGTNNDVVSAINDLSRDIRDLERPSYNINGITYDDGSNIVSAVETLVNAARIEGRS